MNQQNPQKSVKVLLIRHAESLFNHGQRVATKSQSEVRAEHECLITKFSEEFLDCSITPHGYKQCEQAREICLKEDVGIVLVSPLRRALETCEQIFKDHPSNPKIIPNPLFREMVLSNCDIGCRILESRELYKKDDFSFLDNYKYPNLWSLYELIDKAQIEKLIKEIEEKHNNNHEDIIKYGHLHLLETIKNLHPTAIETSLQQFERTQKQKNVIKQLAATLPEGKKIAVVGHARTLYSFTCQLCPDTHQELNGRSFHNGEVFEYEIALD